MKARFTLKQVKQAIRNGLLADFYADALCLARKSMSEDDAKKHVDMLLKQKHVLENIDNDVDAYWAAARTSLGFWWDVGVNIFSGLIAYLLLFGSLVVFNTFVKENKDDDVVNKANTVSERITGASAKK